MWVVEHPDGVEVVVVRVEVKSGWMKRFCDFSLPFFWIIESEKIGV